MISLLSEFVYMWKPLRYFTTAVIQSFITTCLIQGCCFEIIAVFTNLWLFFKISFNRNTLALLSNLYTFVTCCLYFALLNLPHNFYTDMSFLLDNFNYFRLCDQLCYVLTALPLLLTALLYECRLASVNLPWNQTCHWIKK